MNKSFFKEYIKYNKDNIDHIYHTITKYQEHGEKITTNLLKLPQNKDFEAQGKEMIGQYYSFYREGQENFKKMLDESFENAQRIVD